jgi:large subunit ribosomal protein L17
MRHQRSGKKLGRDSAHRKALYSNLAGSLIEHGRIKTTVTKAKAVKPIAEQMITLARRGDLHARRQAVAFLRSKDVVHRLFAEVGPRYADRPGGYSRIIRLGPRPGDAAEMVYLELIDDPLIFKSRLPVEDEASETTAVEETETEDEAEPADEDREAAVEGEEAAGEDEPEAADEEPAAETAEPPTDEEPPAEPDETAGPPPEAESGEQQPRN